MNGKQQNMPKSWHRMETGKTTFGVFLKQGNIFVFCNIPFYYFEGDDIFSSTITENQTQVKEKNTTENV